LIISKVAINIRTANEYHNNCCTIINPNPIKLRARARNTLTIWSAFLLHARLRHHHALNKLSSFVYSTCGVDTALVRLIICCSLHYCQPKSWAVQILMATFEIIKIAWIYHISHFWKLYLHDSISLFGAGYRYDIIFKKWYCRPLMKVIYIACVTMANQVGHSGTISSKQLDIKKFFKFFFRLFCWFEPIWWLF
jgi:hypothetical protein